MSSLTNNPLSRPRRDRDGRRAGDHGRAAAARLRPGGCRRSRFAIGALLLGLALQAAGPRRTVPLSAHAGFDYMLAAVAAVAGLAIGVATGEWGPRNLFGRRWRRPGGVDRINAVQRPRRRLRRPAYLPNTHTHIYLSSLYPETPRQVRGVSFLA